MENTLKIEILVLKKKTSKGKEFNKYVAVKKDGKLVDVSFTKEVKMPTKHCIAIINKDDVNFANKKKENGALVVNKDNEPVKVLWIKAIQGYAPQKEVDALEEKRNAEKEKAVLDAFDEE